MAEERTQRRLAAILAADVVGFSRMMEVDEDATLTALKARRRDVLDPLIAKHQGRIFKTTGDGVLVEFGSAVNAVQCAIDLQQGMAAVNDGQPEDRHIVLRIGVNLGDVMVEGSDLYGEGVNIAARLETLAEPGSILVSGTAYDHIKSKVKVGFDDLGTQALKNIVEPVRAYRVAGTPGVVAAALRPLSDKPSIAVLPFTNMSGDPEQEYFSDGITEDIITELSRFRSLFVIARNSSFQYKSKNPDIQRIARELGVRFVVEGSVRKAGQNIRVTVQLIDGMAGNHLWAERYDRALKDVFLVQDEIVQKLATRLEYRLVSEMTERAQRKLPQNMTAYERCLQARHHLSTSYDWETAEPLARQAVQLDPNYARAHIMLAWCKLHHFYFEPRQELLDEALASAKRSLELDENDAMGEVTLATIHTARREFDLGGIHFDRALKLNPNDIEVNINYCFWLCAVGRIEESVTKLDDVLQREPTPPNYYWDVRYTATMAARRYQDAIHSIAQKKRELYQDHANLAAAHAQLGQHEQARVEVEKLMRMRPDCTIGFLMAGEPFKDPTDAEPLIEGYRKAGIPE